MSRLVIPLTINTYPYWQDHWLELFWYSPSGTVAKKTRYRSVTWDPANTSILSAKLHGRIFADAGTTGQIYFNGELTHWCDSRSMGNTIDTEVDVIGLLRNGQNGVTIELTKFLGVVPQVGQFSAELVLEFSGEEPDVPPPQEEDWWRIPLYMGLGIGGLAVVLFMIGQLRG